MTAKTRLSLCTLFILATVAAPSSAASPCWESVGQQEMFGSTEQGNLLKSVVSANPECPIVGIVWSTDFSKLGGRGVRHSLLLWDEASKSLVRLHVHQGVAWESWTSVTRDSLKAEDMSDGLDFAGYTTGHGKAPLTSAAVNFVKANPSGSGVTPGL